MNQQSMDDRHQTIQSWLRGEPSQCLILLPDELPDPDGFTRTLGLDGARVHRLGSGELRPSFEPHAEVVTHFCEAMPRDVVLVTCTSLRRFDGVGREPMATVFLASQLERLEAYRGIPALPAIDDVRFHGWLWDCERERLVPYSLQAGELLRDEAVPLTRAEVDPPMHGGRPRHAGPRPAELRAS